MSHRKWFVSLIALCPILFLFLTLHVSGQSSPADEALSVVNALNNWRVELGLGPLQQDGTLTKMAEAQASYILSLPDIPEGGAIHLGAHGETVQQRAAVAPYSWPAYRQEMMVGEIAYVGANTNAAIRYWQQSDLHSRTARNAQYRQVGVAALPHRFGYLYIVVFGAQPNLLPVIPDSTGRYLFLTNEHIGADEFDDSWMARASQVRLFDVQGRPLTRTPMEWRSVIPVPEGISGRVTVLLSDSGGHFVMSEVNLDAPQTAVNAPESLMVAVVPTVTFTPTLVPTSAPLVVNTPSAVTGNSAVIPQATRQAATQVAAVATPAISATPVAPAGSPNVRLVYSARTLTLVNISSRPLDVTGILLTNPDNTIRVGAGIWDTEWLSGSLDALAASDCLQLWSWSEANDVPQESDCRQRRGVVTVDPARMFWRTSDIQVMVGGQPVAICPQAQGRCEFAIP